MSAPASGPGIEPAVIDKYGDIKLAFTILSNMSVGQTPPRLKKVARRVEQELRDRPPGQGPDDRLASWAALASDMGLTAPQDLPAPRGLVEDVLAGKTIPKINFVVDCANITALAHLTPVGVFDLDKLVQPLALRLAKPGEALVPILAKRPIACQPDEIVYADSERVFSRYSRDADFSKITEETTRVLCVVDGTSTMTGDYLCKAASFFIELLTGVAHGVECDGPWLASVVPGPTP